MTEPNVGRALALAAHPVCREADPEQLGLPVADLERLLITAGIEIGGTDPRRVLGTAVNNSQDLFQWVEGGRWRWIERVAPKGAGLSGRARAEEAYRLAMLHDPERRGLHYERLKQMLLDEGVTIRGANPGKTMYSSLLNAERWFE
jgi:hypothetical protein